MGGASHPAIPAVPLALDETPRPRRQGRTARWSGSPLSQCFETVATGTFLPQLKTTPPGTAVADCGFKFTSLFARGSAAVSAVIDGCQLYLVLLSAGVSKTLAT